MNAHLALPSGWSLLLLVALVVPRAQAQQEPVQYIGSDRREHRALPTTPAILDARRALEERQDEMAPYIELSRAEAAARQVRAAIATLTRALERWPTSAELYRWRGHRHVSVREFDRALADFERGLTLDSLVYGIWYHLGVARFVRGEFAAAATAFARARPLAPDSAEAAGAADWLWMSLSRAQRPTDAAALLSTLPAFSGIDNAYTRRLRLYRGVLTPSALLSSADTLDTQVATLEFGAGNYLLVRGDTAGAIVRFERAIATTGWNAFGFMAAEAELGRLKARGAAP